MVSRHDLFNIIINSNLSGVCFPGDVITGYVSKLPSNYYLTKNVIVTCRGRACASLKATSSDRGSFRSSRRRFKSLRHLLPPTSKEEFFLLSNICLDECLLQSAIEDAERESLDSSALRQPAQHLIRNRATVFKFALRLPKVLPPSSNFQHGVTSYEVLLEWDTSKNVHGNAAGPQLWQRHKKTIPILVAPLVNLNLIPFTAEPARVSKHSNFSFFCLDFGSMDVSLKVDKIGYVPGEAIRFKVEANNESRFDVQRIAVTLKQERTFHVGDLKKKFCKNLATVEGPCIPQGDSAAWEDSIVVPEVQWKFFWPSSLIQVLFFLQVKLTTHKTSYLAPNPILESSLNVLLGDIPVDPATYAQTFGTTTGLFELDNAVSSSRDQIYGSHRQNRETLWLHRIDHLAEALSSASIFPRRLFTDEPELHPMCPSGEEASSLMIVPTSLPPPVPCPQVPEDTIPSYASLLQNSLGLSQYAVEKFAESPPPSYRDAVLMTSTKPSNPNL